MIKETSGTIQSPGFPSPYPNLEGCVWLIEVSISKLIEFEFESFDIEEEIRCR